MRFFICFFLALFSWAHVLSVNVPAPQYQIDRNNIIFENANYIHPCGAPNLPCKMVTIALPPGAIVESVKFSGIRTNIGIFDIAAVQPPFPMCSENTFNAIQKTYEIQKERFYTSDKLYPETYGLMLSKGGLRKYTLISVACYHFAYKPLSRTLYYTPDISVQIIYRMPAPESERAKFWQDLIDDITFDEIAEELIYNWEDAKVWYKTDAPVRANGYYIILPAVLQNSVDSLVTHRQSQGYDVNIVTKEYIESNVSGDDVPQKIRNYLRQNMADIEYLLLVGFIDDLPWRSVVPWNNDPDSPLNDLSISPIPSDLYYAELTDHDTVSWNSDRDEYYGEVYDSIYQPYGDDNPDYHADIHVGRIPFSTQSIIEDICSKTVVFDMDTDWSYKTASLLAGGMIFFENQDHSGRPRMDGADDMEQLLNDSILARSNAYYLYEKAGLRACPYPCTDSLTRSSMISFWNNRGIVYEFNHGMPDAYYRTIWVWDDGDSVPEAGELQNILCLYETDANQLDNEHPSTTLLRSCSCGKPEVIGLGPCLLQHGSSAVICNSRCGWVTFSDRLDIAGHFLDRLMKDTTASYGVIGKAYDLGRNDFMDSCMFWIPAYHHNLYGDPALRQFGRITSISEVADKKNIYSCALYPNPTSGQIMVQLNTAIEKKVEIDAFDISGRFVQHLYDGHIKQGTKTMDTKLPAGVYFLKIKDDDNAVFKKFVIVK